MGLSRGFTSFWPAFVWKLDFIVFTFDLPREWEVGCRTKTETGRVLVKNESWAQPIRAGSQSDSKVPLIANNIVVALFLIHDAIPIMSFNN